MEKKITKRMHITIIVLFFCFSVLAILAFRYAYTSIRPIIFGIIIAYIFRPMCNVLYDKILLIIGKKRRTRRIKLISHVLSMALTYLIWGAIFIFVAFLIMPSVANSLISIFRGLPDYVQRILDFFEYHFKDAEIFNNYPPIVAESLTKSFESWYETDFSPMLKNLASITISGATVTIINTFRLLFDILIGFIASVYLLNSRKQFAAQGKIILRAVFGLKASTLILDECKFADRMFAGFFIGKIIDSAIVSVICYVLCLLMRTPYPLLISSIVGITDIIPFFGPYIGMVAGAAIVLTASPIHALTFVLMLIVLQQFDGNILGPKIIGNKIGLSGFWVLFSILLFGGLFGFFGLFIGVPVFAVICDIFTKIIKFCLKKRDDTIILEDYEEEFSNDKGD